MAEVLYAFGDQSQARILQAMVDPFMRIKDLTPALIPFMKLPRVDIRGVEIIYLLAYQGVYLSQEDTLNGAGIPAGEQIDVIGRAIDLGARHEREWQDFSDIVALQEAHRNIFDLEIRGRAFDDAPLGYRMTLKGVAGPVVDPSQIQRTSAPPLTDSSGDLILADQFTVEIFVLERYPFIEPAFFYVDPILFHPNVNPFSRKACLYKKWRPINSFAESVQRFVEQISHVAPYAEGVDLLNFAAIKYMQTYKSTHAGAVPFVNRRGQGPPVLRQINEERVIAAAVDEDWDPDYIPTIK